MLLSTGRIGRHRNRGQAGNGVEAMGVAARGLETIATLRDLWDRLRGRPLGPRPFRPNGWQADEHVVLARYHEIDELAAIELAVAFAEGRISLTDRLIEQRHRVMQRPEAEGWLLYRRERW